MLNSWSWEKWYGALDKPSWTPSGGTIGMIWGFLYPIIFISFGYVFYKVYQGTFPRKVLLPFLVNLISNFLYTPLFFGLKNVPLATLDIIIVLGSIVWCIYTISNYSKFVAWAQVPYLAWVILATTLQLSIFLNN